MAFDLLVFSGNERPAPLSEPPQTQLEKHFHDWFAAIERNPHQLPEMERSAYLDMKRKEYRREQAGLPEIGASRDDCNLIEVVSVRERTDRR